MALILVIIYVKREDIEQKIENYLVEHSEIKARTPEDELSIDLKND